MKRLVKVALVLGMGLLARPAAAADLGCASCSTCSTCDAGCGSCCTPKNHCKPIPEEPCPDCGCACDKFRIPALFGHDHVCKLVEALHDCESGVRVRAARRLGRKIEANICEDHEVLEALIHALQCDMCWEVRAAAAESLLSQDARVPEAIAALYIANKLDHHYLVRDASSTALSTLLLCRKACYKDLFKAADDLIKKIKKDYDPTKGKCPNILTEFCSTCGEHCGCGGGEVITSAPAGVIMQGQPTRVMEVAPTAPPVAAQPMPMPAAEQLAVPPAAK